MCWNMLTKFSKSDHHKAALAHALRENGLETIDEVTDGKLFYVCEAARAALGWGTGLMLASTAFGLKPADLGVQPQSVRDKIDAMARDFYASGKADEEDVEIVPRPALKEDEMKRFGDPLGFAYDKMRN